MLFRSEFVGVSDDEIVALARRESARVVMTVLSARGTRGSGSGLDRGRGRIWSGHSTAQLGAAEWQSNCYGSTDRSDHYGFLESSVTTRLWLDVGELSRSVQT